MEARKRGLEERKQRLVLSSAILVSGIGFLMGSAINIAVPTIQDYFAASMTEIQWILNGYTIALGSLILASGALIDRFGLKRTYMLGMIFFFIGSMLCALAWNVLSLISFRIIQGLGAALMIPGSLAAIKQAYPSGGQGKAIGLWAGISGAIAGLGPFLGGFLTEYSWRYLFLSMLPFTAAALWMTNRALPSSSRKESTGRGLDAAGFLFSAGGLFALTYGLIGIAGEGRRISSAAGIAAGLLLLFIFAGVERRRSRKELHTLVPGKIFTPTVKAANIATFFLYFAFSGILFLLSLNLQQLQGYRPFTAGLLIMPATILIPFLSGPSGVLTDRIGPSLQMRTGPLLFAAGSALLLAGGPSADYLSAFLPGMLILGTGMVIIIPAITSSAIAVEPRYSGTASGFNNAAARISGLFAVAVSGAILAAGYSWYLEAALEVIPVSAGSREAILQESGRLLSAPLPDTVASGMSAAVETARRSAYGSAYRWAVGVNIAAALAAAAAGWSVPRLQGLPAGKEHSNHG